MDQNLDQTKIIWTIPRQAPENHQEFKLGKTTITWRFTVLKNKGQTEVLPVLPPTAPFGITKKLSDLTYVFCFFRTTHPPMSA